MYKLMVMSFDGDNKIEGNFSSISEAWDYSNDMGSRWSFYPFHFVVTESGKTIKDTYDLLSWTKNMRVKKVKAIFLKASSMPEAKNMDAEEYLFFIMDNL